MPRRALWVNQFAATPADGGGTRHFEFARELRAQEWEVTLVASDFHLQRRTFTRRPSASSRAPVVEMIEGVSFRWLWSFPYASNDWRRMLNWLSFAFEVWRMGADDGPPPDVVIGSSPQLFAALGAWALARRHRVPFIFEVRDLWPESLEAVSGQRGLGYHLLGAVARFLYRRADRVIVLARGSAPVVAAAGVPDSRIVYVPNGVDASTFTDLTRPPRDRLTAVYAGAHGPANGLEVLIEAAALLRDVPNIRILLIGDGPAKPGLVAEVARRRLTNIEFRSAVGKRELSGVFADADAGLMVLRDTPLFRWGISPNKLFDYLAAALPVACNVQGDVATMLAAAEAGEQTADASPAALAAALRRLARRSPAERRAMGDRGREWVLREHNRHYLAAGVAKVLDDLVAR